MPLMAFGARVTDFEFAFGEHGNRSKSSSGRSRGCSRRRGLFTSFCRSFSALLGRSRPTLLRSGWFRSELQLSTCYLSVTVIVQHVLYDLCHLLLQSVDEELWRVFAVLNVSEFLLPNTRELATGEQFLTSTR